MAQQLESMVRIRDFRGLVSFGGALANEPGEASAQTNMHSLVPGSLRVRKGRQELAFVTGHGETPGSFDVTTMYQHRGTETSRLFMFTSTGKIIVAITPS